MSACVRHRIGVGEEKRFSCRSSGYLALVDVDSYRAFAGEGIDHLDMMAHLHREMSGLRAIAWGSPQALLRIRVVVTEDHVAAERAALVGGAEPIQGSVRTTGQLCFAAGDRLDDCARSQTHGLLETGLSTAISPPRLFLVPAGIYSVLVFYHFNILEVGKGPAHEVPIHYTVILRHYPFPPPRVAPTRLGSLIPWAA